jgi:hypothetical protein
VYVLVWISKLLASVPVILARVNLSFDLCKVTRESGVKGTWRLSLIDRIDKAKRIVSVRYTR